LIDPRPAKNLLDGEPNIHEAIFWVESTAFSKNFSNCRTKGQKLEKKEEGEPELKGSFRLLRDRGLKITDYYENIPT
jgi:hypothetical protein